MVGGFRDWVVISLYAMATQFMPNRVYIWLCLGLSTLSVMRSLSVPCQAVCRIYCGWSENHSKNQYLRYCQSDFESLTPYNRGILLTLYQDFPRTGENNFTAKNSQLNCNIPLISAHIRKSIRLTCANFTHS